MSAMLAVLMLLALAPKMVAAENEVKCQGLYYRASRILSEPMGFCWYFFNGNYSLREAEYQCARHAGRLPAINSDNKAAKLANFSSSVRHLYFNGSYDKSWLPVYAAGWQGNVLWGDRIIRNGDQKVWKVTGAPVSYQAFDESTDLWNRDESCTTFDMFTGKWRYASCMGVHTMTCEEEGHEYKDEPPTEVERTYLAESCPRHFKLENGRCLLLGGVSGVYAANLLCFHRGGYLAVVTSENDLKALGNFVSKRHLSQWTAFLSPIIYTKERFIWESTGQSADYVAQMMDLAPNQRILSDTLIVMKGDGKLEECPRWRCNARAFCQANSEDYYAYAGEEPVDDYNYDYDDAE